MMPPVVSVHEYRLRPSADPMEFERAFAQARRRGLFALPGLRDARLLRTLRGTGGHAYAALWTYESREAWEALWGPPGAPAPKQAYPDAWHEWEEVVLAPFLDREPDAVEYAAYEEI
jgi:hypothetical protein